MEAITQFLQGFVDLGASIMLPVIIFVFAIILKIKPGKAFTAGLTVGIGFVGLNLVIGLLTDTVGPAASAMVDKFGLSLQTIDVGWPAASAIAYGTILGAMAIPVGIIVNLILLLLGLTRTMNIDIWNFWHIAFSGSIVYMITNDFALGLFTMVTHSLLLYFVADVSAKDIEETYGLPNMTFPQGASIAGYITAKPLAWVFDRIPGLNHVHLDSDTIQEKIGVLGNNTVIGVIIGLVIGLLAGYDVKETLTVGVNTGAVMMLMPRMVSLLMEGLTPISERANELLQNHFPDRDLYIGMDSALAVGQSSVLATSLILVPVTLLLAVILPGNHVLPLGDLATLPFMIALMTAVFRGDVLRSLLGGIVHVIVSLYIATWAAPYITQAAQASGFDLKGATSISVLSDGGAWSTILFGGLSQWIGWIGVSIVFVVLLFGLYAVNKRKTNV
ncbi:MAG: PTS transporter subunit IIC [Aerococcus sp.]|nr:PTS transporter subunit IIC [Aerococcus sp.]